MERLPLYEETAARHPLLFPLERRHRPLDPPTEEIRLSVQPEHVQTSDVGRKLGRLPNDPTKPRLRLAPFLTTAAVEAPANPQVVDWMSRAGDWPMYANDRYGDCMWADIAHSIQAASTYGRGATVTVSEVEVLAAYSGCTGFNPNDPATDQGTVMQDAMNYWRKTGVGGHTILAFAQVDHTNRDEVYAALNVFGALHLGISFPAYAMEQFDRGLPWDVQQHNAKIEGGHAIHAGYYSDPDNAVHVTTWGKRQPMTDAFFDAYVEEAWVAITPEWLSAAGTTPTGLDLHGLGSELASLTGGPNPFPETPVPEPAPGPQPAPPTPPIPAPVPAPEPTDDASFWVWLRWVVGVLDRFLTGKGV